MTIYIIYSRVQVTSSCVVSMKVACGQNLTSADFGNLMRWVQGFWSSRMFDVAHLSDLVDISRVWTFFASALNISKHHWISCDVLFTSAVVSTCFYPPKRDAKISSQDVARLQPSHRICSICWWSPFLQSQIQHAKSDIMPSPVVKRHQPLSRFLNVLRLSRPSSSQYLALSCSACGELSIPIFVQSWSMALPICPLSRNSWIQSFEKTVGPRLEGPRLQSEVSSVKHLLVFLDIVG